MTLRALLYFLITIFALFSVVHESEAQRIRRRPSRTAVSRTKKQTEKDSLANAEKAKLSDKPPLKEKQSLAVDGLFKRENIVKRKPIPLQYIREADVMWSKRIWRMIDLRQKMNQTLYYPTEEIKLRKSLVQTLVDAIRKSEIRAFDPDEDDEFTTIIPPEGLSERFGAGDIQETRRKLDDSGDTTIIIPGEYRWDEVQTLYIKEDWFFDRHHSKMMVRIVGICPIRVYKRTLRTADGDETDAEVLKKQLFWVHYEEARPILARTSAYMPQNDATQLSLDDIFSKRRFESYIVKESNVHNNRAISSYTTSGYFSLLESERIRKEIMQFEHDLWEF